MRTKPIPLNLTPRRKEVLWHAAYNESDWSARPTPGNRWAGHWIRLGGTEVREILTKLSRARLIRVEIRDVTRWRSEVNVRITPLGMDVLLGNVECVDPKKCDTEQYRKIR